MAVNFPNNVQNKTPTPKKITPYNFKRIMELPSKVNSKLQNCR